MLNQRKRIPPRDPALRRRYYGLLGKAAKTTSGAQRQHLRTLARALMVWVEVDAASSTPQALRKRETGPRAD